HLLSRRFPYTTLFRSIEPYPRALALRLERPFAVEIGKRTIDGFGRDGARFGIGLDAARIGLRHRPEFERHAGVTNVALHSIVARSEEHTSELQSRENL